MPFIGRLHPVLIHFPIALVIAAAAAETALDVISRCESSNRDHGRAARSRMQTAAAHEVVMDNFSFAPAAASVPVDTTITWTNRDDVPHNAVSTEQKFKSPVLDTDEEFSHRFDAPGAYKYFCSIHPK